GERSKIRSEWIRSFESLKDLEKYAEKCEDYHLMGISQVVRRHSKHFPDAIFDFMNANKAGKGGRDEVILSTIHASKGQEYERVYIDSDVSDMLSAIDRPKGKMLDEEANIAYVGFTRAANDLMLPGSFKGVLTSEWQEFLEDRAPEDSPPEPVGRGRVSQGERKIDGRRKSKVAPADFSSNPRRKSRAPKSPSPKVGDVVETSNGRGAVVEVSGEYCLVALEGQRAKLRERVSCVRVHKKP
ncbi:MAG: 3'-5' exonuclease, partial [Acidobacteriota bacterium]